MSTRLSLTAMSIVILLAGAGLAETLEVPLSFDVVYDSFDLVPFTTTPIAGFLSASLRLAGTGAPALLWCDDPVGPNPQEVDHDASFAFGDAAGSDWNAFLDYLFLRSGAFDVTLPLEYNNPADWDFLLDGTGDMMVYFSGAIDFGDPNHCGMLSNPDFQVDTCTLIIECETIIPLEASSWGMIKEIYR
jgi:hypothetical protein